MHQFTANMILDLHIGLYLQYGLSTEWLLLCNHSPTALNDL